MIGMHRRVVSSNTLLENIEMLILGLDSSFNDSFSVAYLLLILFFKRLSCLLIAWVNEGVVTSLLLSHIITPDISACQQQFKATLCAELAESAE